MTIDPDRMWLATMVVFVGVLGAAAISEVLRVLFAALAKRRRR